MTRAAQHFLLWFLAPFLLILCGLVLVAHADTGIPGPASVDSTVRWWQDGKLAGPVVLGVYGLLRLVVALSNGRNRRLAWLRKPDRLALVSSAVGALGVLLPAAAAHTLTWGGALLALTSGSMLYASGSARPVAPPATREDDAGVADGSVPS